MCWTFVMFTCRVYAVCVFLVDVTCNSSVCEVYKSRLYFMFVLCNEHLWYVGICAVSVYFSYALNLLRTVYAHTTFYCRARKWRQCHTAVLHGNLSPTTFGFLVPRRWSSSKSCRCKGEGLSERKLRKAKIYITGRNGRSAGSRFVHVLFYIGIGTGMPVVTSSRLSWLLHVLNVIVEWAAFLFCIGYILDCTVGQVIVIPNVHIIYL